MESADAVAPRTPSIQGVSLFAGLIALLSVLSAASAQSDLGRFDGSFRLQTGEVVTGGYFVENGEGRFLYMDTEGLRKAGLFERTGPAQFRSIVPDGEFEIEFLPDSDGSLNTLVWRAKGHDAVRGERVHPHRSREVSFLSADGTELHGRLLVPVGTGPHPVVVSVHGSGPVNRYGGAYHTDFLRHGLAVLAYDKRGYTSDRQRWREPDLAILAADAAAAVRYAATQEELDHGRIGIVGSSQAGWVVPRAAIEAPQTAFIVLRAGAAASVSQTMLHEVRQELRLAGLDGLALDQALEVRDEIHALAMSGAPISATDSLVEPYLEAPWYATAFGQGRISDRWSAAWWQWLQHNLSADGTTHLKQFGGPSLWFLAEMDENVPLVSTRAALDRALEAAPSDDHEIVVLEDALHSFLIPTADGSPRFSPGYFDHLGKWLADHGYTNPARENQSAK